MFGVIGFRSAAGRSAGLSCAVAAAGLMTASAANAQVTRPPVSIDVGRVRVLTAPRADALTEPRPGGIRCSLERLDYGALISNEAQTQPARRRSSVGRKILGGALGGVGGFFAGGYIGAKIDGRCDCDDPGFKGFLIGAPIGSVVGAILGAKLF
jgi:hypothetical protein